ncbi:MAG: hypothetical protein JXB38_17035 [Anaerolineales bacterium]|nr:hypothetical protein [Anaerolineales bacterium]
MKENKKAIEISIGIFGIILFMVVFCLFLEIWSSLYDDEENTTRSEAYAIDPDTLLQDVENGNLDAAFDYIEDYSRYDPESYHPPTNWSGEDMYFMLSEFFTYVTGDNLGDWQVHEADFKASCNADSFRFNYSGFVVFKNLTIDNKPYRWMRRFYIEAIPREAVFIEKEVHNNNAFPAPQKWKSIDYQNLSISVEEALLIAFDQYSSEIESWDEGCKHVLILNRAEDSFNGWRLFFRESSDIPSSHLSLVVDDSTGEIELISR